MDWTVRLVGSDEAETVLQAEVFDGPALAAATAGFLSGPQNIMVLAEMDGLAVGFASGTVLDHPDKPPSLLIQELGVNEPAQRRGIARVLLAALRDEGRRRGCRGSWVLTEDDNVAAKATYRAAGGREITGVVMYEWDEGASSA